MQLLLCGRARCACRLHHMSRLSIAFNPTSASSAPASRGCQCISHAAHRQPHTLASPNTLRSAPASWPTGAATVRGSSFSLGRSEAASTSRAHHTRKQHTSRRSRVGTGLTAVVWASQSGELWHACTVAVVRVARVAVAAAAAGS